MRVLIKTSGRGGYIHALDHDESKSLCQSVHTDWKEWEIVEREQDFLKLPLRERCLACTRILTRKMEPLKKTKQELMHEQEMKKLMQWNAG